MPSPPRRAGGERRAGAKSARSHALRWRHAPRSLIIHRSRKGKCTVSDSGAVCTPDAVTILSFDRRDVEEFARTHRRRRARHGIRVDGGRRRDRRRRPRADGRQRGQRLRDLRGQGRQGRRHRARYRASLPARTGFISTRRATAAPPMARAQAAISIRTARGTAVIRRRNTMPATCRYWKPMPQAMRHSPWKLAA